MPSQAIASVIRPRAADIGGFTVRRALPSPGRRTVGPFVFWDEMGPGVFAPGSGIDVRPHPHIGLATVTYLFDGGILHRDSLGSVQEIEPGALNWMSAGRGIVHSERTGPERRAAGHRLHGIQAWVGLPKELENGDPEFVHVPATELPSWSEDGADLRLIAGTSHGRRSPAPVSSPTLYLQAELHERAALIVDDEHEERAIYVVSGRILVGGDAVDAGSLAVLTPGVRLELRADGPSRALVFGGAPLDGPRHLRWNFVASHRPVIDEAERDWNASISSGFEGSRFALPPGEDEHIPLPGAPSGPPEPCAECPTT